MSHTVTGRKAVRGLEKRKACDLCHIKKIRCDGNKPTCFHCVVYEAKCTYTPHIKKRRHEVKVQPSEATPDIITAGSVLQDGEPPAPDFGISPLLEPAPAASSLPLPNILPVIEDYFTNLNGIIPLFDQDTFLDLLNEGSTSAGRDALTNAAVNVILALTYGNHATSHPPIASLDTETCISEALSVVDTLSDPQEDFLGLQVLLGAVILRLGMPYHTRPLASALIASAVKLIHRLGLHQSKVNTYFNPGMSLQRSRVFWIAYCADRDISMRGSDPPLQQEDDQDIVIPASVPGYGLVSFTDASGGDNTQIHFDFFRARIRLAHIQGIIYDQLRSVRGSKQSPELRRRSTERIRGMLREWRAAIPAELDPGRLGSVSPYAAVRQLTVLWIAYFSCLQSTYGVGAHDAEWIARLVDYSQQVVGFADPGAAASSLAPETFSGPSPDWAEVIPAARECVRLFRTVNRDDSAMMWSSFCTYISSALVLTANVLTVPDQGADCDADADVELVSETPRVIAWAAAESQPPDSFRHIHDACAELACRARIVRTRSTLGQTGPKSASVAWLEEEARRSSGRSALELVKAFTAGGQKPLITRLRQPQYGAEKGC